MTLRRSPSGPGFVPSHVHFGHMSFGTAAPFTLVGSGAAPVEIPDNPPAIYEPPDPPTLNEGFSIVNPSGNIKRLQWDDEHIVTAMVTYYGTFQLVAGGTSLAELSMAINGIQHSDKLLTQLSGNRPNFISNTTVVRLNPGDAISPMIEDVGGATEIQAYSAHISIVASVDLS